MTGQCYQWHQLTEPGVGVVVAAVAAGCRSTARAAVVAVEAAQRMKGVKILAEGSKIEVLVEEVGPHDTVNGRGAVRAVGCLGEGEEHAGRGRERSLGRVRKVGSNWLLQACAK